MGSLMLTVMGFAKIVGAERASSKLAYDEISARLNSNEKLFSRTVSRSSMGSIVDGLELLPEPESEGRLMSQVTWEVPRVLKADPSSILPLAAKSSSLLTTFETISGCFLSRLVLFVYPILSLAF